MTIYSEPMPNAPKPGTSVRTLRIDDATWQRLTELAKSRDLTTSELLRQIIAAHLRRHR